MLGVLGACGSGTVGAQAPVDTAQPAAYPMRMAVGVHGGIESAGDTEHIVLGGRAVVPIAWRALAQLSLNWHRPTGPDFGEGTLAVRVHPLPTPFYIAAGAGLRNAADLVRGDRALSGVWLLGLGFQVRVWRLWPYLELQNLNADPVLRLLGGIAFTPGFWAEQTPHQ